MKATRDVGYKERKTFESAGRLRGRASDLGKEIRVWPCSRMLKEQKCVVKRSMIGVVFVHHGIHDVADNHSLNVIEQDVDPHAKNCDSEPIAYKEYRFVLKSVAN